MCKTFKINIYFDENGEKIEKLIKHLIINRLQKNIFDIKNLS